MGETIWASCVCANSTQCATTAAIPSGITTRRFIAASSSPMSTAPSTGVPKTRLQGRERTGPRRCRVIFLPVAVYCSIKQTGSESDFLRLLLPQPPVLNQRQRRQLFKRRLFVEAIGGTALGPIGDTPLELDRSCGFLPFFKVDGWQVRRCRVRQLMELGRVALVLTLNAAKAGE